MTPDQRTLIGEHVRKRRISLGVSVAQAARDAGIGRSTWIAIEAGSRDTEDHTLGRVESALRWTPGTIDGLAGGGPDAGAGPETAGGDWVARLIAIRDNPRRSAHLRAMAAAHLAQLEALLAAADAEDAQRAPDERAG
ncbi:helix-turn-helix domain-containing protein [Catenuloplanes atrovinosus]|uniref:DNA-binding XRE family transcriptional regulator n=1 Tax=Catenuloplanes atrovinosus TaxID=137266 RepID=A0AAE3YLW1_9ACTN|nr:helix-turn-helix domain-containing protein [Catenuloplanes atrovinosus]MDR7274711.1 DNA-binding XRE family transcriptional regulator [Catenuloplanes atrovinosus]